MRKICMLTSSHSPKDDRIFYKEALSLRKAGFQVTIICAADKKGFVKDMGGNIINKSGRKEFLLSGIKIISLPKSDTRLDKFLGKFYLSPFYRKMKQKAEQEGADAYHAHELDTLMVALSIQKKVNCRVIFDSHESWNTHSWHYVIFETFFIHRLKYLITVNELIQGVFLSKKPMLISEVVYNTSTPTVMKPFYDKKKFKNLIIVHEGSLKFNRGLGDIIEAFYRISKEFPHVKLRIIGDLYGLEKQYFNTKINEYGLANKIEVTGWLKYESVGHKLKGCSIGLISYTHTPNNAFSTPNKLFNYMAYGIAVVSVNITKIASIINNYECGLVIKNRSPANLYLAIKSLIDKPAVLRTMCQNSFNAYHYYNWKKDEKKLLRFYQQVVLK